VRTRIPTVSLWFTENDLNPVGRITPLEVITKFGAGSSPGANVFGIAAGAENKASRQGLHSN